MSIPLTEDQEMLTDNEDANISSSSLSDSDNGNRNNQITAVLQDQDMVPPLLDNNMPPLQRSNTVEPISEAITPALVLQHSQT